MDIEKRIQSLAARLKYIQDIFAEREDANIELLHSKLKDFTDNGGAMSAQEAARQVEALEDLYAFLEKKLERELTPWTRCASCATRSASA